MEPVSALVFACISAWAITRAFSEAAIDQARAEAHTAAAAIREDLRRRGTDWSRKLGRRLENGRAGGPSTALWWGWAGLRTARTIRKAMRKQPRAEEAQKALRGDIGPWSRIWAAGVRGAQFAREEYRRQQGGRAQGDPSSGHDRAGQRASDERRDGRRFSGQGERGRRAHVPVGVYGRCGVVTTRKALEWAPTPTGTRERMCAKCRAELEAKQRADQQPTTDPGPGPGPDVHDADVVEDRPQLNRPRPELGPPDRAPQAPAQPPNRPASPPPAGPSSGPAPQPLPAPPNTSTEGELMPPRTPGLVVARRSPLPARAASGTGGESYTHGQWQRATTDIEQRLADLPAVLEAMLQCLTAADAGRTQVKGVLLLNEQIIAFLGQVNAMLREVNRREQPVVVAVERAGGPDEIASIPYLSDV